MSAVETAAQALDVYLPVTAYPRDAVARRAARDAFASIDIDGVARALYLDDCRWADIDPETAAAAWADLKEDGVTRRAYRERAAAVKAHLLGGERP